MASTDPLPPDAPRPRLCHMRKKPDFPGYGFNLHAEKNRPGQYIGKVDPGSPAEAAGLREGDRIVEVNGTNVAMENHQQVVERIKAVSDETKFLVVDEAAEAYYRERNIIVSSHMTNVEVIEIPVETPCNDVISNGSGAEDSGELSAAKLR
jgi:C-terminal processing protease CtpA/Prc